MTPPPDNQPVPDAPTPFSDSVCIKLGLTSFDEVATHLVTLERELAFHKANAARLGSMLETQREWWEKFAEQNDGNEPLHSLAIKLEQKLRANLLAAGWGEE